MDTETVEMRLLLIFKSSNRVNVFKALKTVTIESNGLTCHRNNVICCWTSLILSVFSSTQQLEQLFRPNCYELPEELEAYSNPHWNLEEEVNGVH